MKFKLTFGKKDIDIQDMLKKAASKVVGPDPQLVQEVAKLRHEKQLLEAIVVSYRERLANYCVMLTNEEGVDTLVSSMTPFDIGNDLADIFNLENEVFGEDD